MKPLLETRGRRWRVLPFEPPKNDEVHDFSGANYLLCVAFFNKKTKIEERIIASYLAKV